MMVRCTAACAIRNDRPLQIGFGIKSKASALALTDARLDALKCVVQLARESDLPDLANFSAKADTDHPCKTTDEFRARVKRWEDLHRRLYIQNPYGAELVLRDAAGQIIGTEGITPLELSPELNGSQAARPRKPAHGKLTQADRKAHGFLSNLLIRPDMRGQKRATVLQSVAERYAGMVMKFKFLHTDPLLSTKYQLPAWNRRQGFQMWSVARPPLPQPVISLATTHYLKHNRLLMWKALSNPEAQPK